MISRREFIAGLSAAAVGAPAAIAQTRISAPGAIRFGYAAITWGGHDLDAMADIAAAGYPGIQIRSTILSEYASRPAALREELGRHKLTFVALSSGNLRIDPAAEAEDLATHSAHAKFVRDAGGLFLQIIDERPRGRETTSADRVRLARLLTELGKRTADAGVSLAYHHHMNSIGQPPDAIARIMDAADSRYVKLLLDIAHYQQGGGDPVRAVKQYADRLAFLHIKDVESTVKKDVESTVKKDVESTGSDRSDRPGRAGEPGRENPRYSPDLPDLPDLPDRGYRFVELGRGRVDIKGVFAALAEVNYRGWAVIELDAVPDNARTPKESALVNKRFVEETLGLRVS